MSEGKYSLRVIYSTDTAFTTVLENVSLEEVVERAEEINLQHGNDSVGFYIERVKD